MAALRRLGFEFGAGVFCQNASFTLMGRGRAASGSQASAPVTQAPLVITSSNAEPNFSGASAARDSLKVGE